MARIRWEHTHFKRNPYTQTSNKLKTLKPCGALALANQLHNLHKLHFNILPKSVCPRTLDSLMHCTSQDSTELIRINFSELRVEDAFMRPLKKLMRQTCARAGTSVPSATRVSKYRRKRDVPVSQPGSLSERRPELAIVDCDIVHVRKILKSFAIALLPKNA